MSSSLDRKVDSTIAPPASPIRELSVPIPEIKNIRTIPQNSSVAMPALFLLTNLPAFTLNAAITEVPASATSSAFSTVLPAFLALRMLSA